MREGLPILGIDMDDVTADMTKGVIEMYNKEREGSISREELNCWYGNWNVLKEFYLRGDLYSDLEVMEGSQEVLRELSKDFNILFVTASPTPEITKVKMDWIDEHFPEIGSGNVIATRYKYLVKMDVLFDDSPEFLPKFEGHRILMDMIYNEELVEGHHMEKRVKDWYEFRDYVYEIYSKEIV